MNNSSENNERYAWYVLFLLTLANISSFLDRQILALLVQPIKRDFHLSDTKMSLLMGLSFGIFIQFLECFLEELPTVIAVGILFWVV
jgi:hypothetical protein